MSATALENRRPHSKQLPRRARSKSKPSAHSLEGRATAAPVGAAADLRARARHLMACEIEFMAHPWFTDPAAKAELLAPPPAGRSKRASFDLSDVRRAASPYVASLYETELLTPAQEAHLFRQMNYLKFRADQLRQTLKPVRPSAKVVLEVERLLAQANLVRNQIISANLRLVVSVAKGYVDDANSFVDLVSDGNLSLMRAVEKFDVSRGFRFSTYATWAIRKNYSRSIAKRRFERQRCATGDEQILELAADSSDGDPHPEQRLIRLRSAVSQVLARLDPRERTVVAARFGLDEQGEPHTLAALGQVMGISKERVRQLESRALKKLRALADETSLAASAE